MYKLGAELGTRSLGVPEYSVVGLPFWAGGGSAMLYQDRLEPSRPPLAGLDFYCIWHLTDFKMSSPF